jgi:hypothetical protein
VLLTDVVREIVVLWLPGWLLAVPEEVEAEDASEDAVEDGVDCTDKEVEEI